MIKIENIKPWTINFMAFFVLFSFSPLTIEGQNVLEKHITANEIKTISINGNQIFNISVSTSKTNQITVVSTLDGEYQNDYQIVIIEVKNTLNLSLEHVSLEEIPDDKRNAHKVIAATLQLKIPEQLKLHIISDIASVDLNGDFNSLYIELWRGKCNVIGNANSSTINTIDGDINVMTQNATIEANSNHGEIELDEFSNSISIWTLTSIHGDITVAKR